MAAELYMAVGPVIRALAAETIGRGSNLVSVQFLRRLAAVLSVFLFAKRIFDIMWFGFRHFWVRENLSECYDTRSAAPSIKSDVVRSCISQGTGGASSQYLGTSLQQQPSEPNPLPDHLDPTQLESGILTSSFWPPSHDRCLNPHSPGFFTFFATTLALLNH